MRFSEFMNLFTKHFNDMVSDINFLFETRADKDKLWELYLESFPAESNKIFRKRREFDCSCCRHFVKGFGGVVAIKGNCICTIWDFQTGDSTYQPVLDTLSAYVKSQPVTDIFVSKLEHIGVNHNHDKIDGKIVRWDHLCVDLPRRFVNESHQSIGDIKGQFRDVRNVFKRSLDEISRDSIETVLELIGQNSLYRGAEWKNVLKSFLSYKKEYDRTPEEQRENYTWEKSVVAGEVVGKIRNHSIGTLLTNISEGMDLDTAVRKYEEIVAPVNYKRPKAIFTKKMLEQAQKTIEELGYMDSLPRRFATLDDITVNNILFSNRDASKRISGGNVFEEMAADIPENPKKFSKVEEITAEKFVSDVLPAAKELSVFLESKHARNMVSLIAPQNPEAPTMFKWNNGFSWAYTGNIADSEIRENVKAAGGKVDGVLRFSIQWNDLDYDPNDLDAHCKEPSGEHIYYGSRARKPGRSRTGGQLDVDIINPTRGIPAVENITWPDKSRMDPGTYEFWVNPYCHMGGRKGFRAEIEFDGAVYQFDYPNNVQRAVVVASVTLSEDGRFSIKTHLSSSMSSREIWGVKTNQFVPVSVAMYSPNYWDEQKRIGNRHYFFMLKGCVNPEKPNAFYNEFLKEELLQHKRVFEALGGKMAVQDVPDQLSGVGFSDTRRAELIVKIKGNTERTLKIKF